MPSKAFVLENGLAVTIYKRRSSRHIRLTVAADGAVRVSVPAWASYRVGLEFARSRADWIREQARSPQLLIDGQAVGKAHRLRFVVDPLATKPSGRLTPGTVTVRYPAGLPSSSPTVQAAATEAAIRALRKQAEALLPQRLQALSQQFELPYTSVAIKRLTGRWGSCDSRKHIVFNLFLMQLPWDLIDYVILHELAHTEVLRHGPDFWAVMDGLAPNHKALRKQLRGHQPILVGGA